MTKIHLFMWRALSKAVAVADSIAAHGMQTDVIFPVCHGAAQNQFSMCCLNVFMREKLENCTYSCDPEWLGFDRRLSRQAM